MLLIRPLSAGDAGYLYVAEIQDVIQDVLRGMCVRDMLRCMGGM